ncbi:diguanylate cyclase [Sphingomonas rubra]|uniref:diguanylate cyclase n=2 Tax=Sphingomonas rubra TaxID=634430 RepID=A0A1I5TW94_9SPHN|nr:diguanylate cyclase [Sphingomonas rubra]
MGGAAIRNASAGDLYACIGAFLVAHRLSPDPLHYAFAHAALSGTDPALAAEVQRLTDGGFRLTQADVMRLAGTVSGAPALPDRSRHVADTTGSVLAAAAQMQVDGFAEIVRGIHDDTKGFGRDLAVSVATIEQTPTGGRAEVARIAGAMIRRVRDSEERLARATDEADALRAKLADAHAVARRDPLTGLANRLALSEALAARDGTHCLALCDVDRFKAINDAHGHNVGDRVLRAIADTLASICDGHLVTRHGGEEFAVLMTGTTIAQAVALIDSARAAVSTRRLRTRETDAPIGAVTFSAGVTAMRHDEAVEQVFDRADRLLYTAKAQGRDRTCAE